MALPTTGAALLLLALCGPLAAHARLLRSEQSLHAAARHHDHGRQDRGEGARAQFAANQAWNNGGGPGGFAGGAAPFVGGGGAPFIGGGGGFGGAGWIGTAGAVATGVDYGVGVATQLLAPPVNAIASNVPIMLPSMDGRCFRGEPVQLRADGPVMCVVGNGAQVTNYLFNAANLLVDAAGRGVGLLGQFVGRR